MSASPARSRAKARKACPNSTWTAKANGTSTAKTIDFEGGLTLLSDRAFVDYEGTEYEVDPTTFGFVKSGSNRPRTGWRKTTGEVTACQEAAARLNVGDFVDNLKNEGSADVDGTATTKISGDLNAGRRDRRARSN